MIHIFSDIVQIIVFSTSSDALLAVRSPHQATHVTVGVNSSLENWLELKQTLFMWTRVSCFSVE